MSAEKFTPGRIHTGNGNGEGHLFADLDNVRMRFETDKGTCLFPIAKINVGFDTDEDEGNLRRLAAAWNAFVGIDTGTIEQIAGGSIQALVVGAMSRWPAHQRLIHLLEKVERAVEIKSNLTDEDFAELGAIARDARQLLST